MQLPLEITVLRSGIPDTVPGRSLNVCERGMAAVIASELTAGENVGVEVQLSGAAEPLRTRATVRHHDKLRCGLEFVAISAEQRSAIRDWAKGAKAEIETAVAAPVSQKREWQGEVPASFPPGDHGPMRKRRTKAAWWWLLLFLIGIGGAIFWWKWNRSWSELESDLKGTEATSSNKPQVQVPAEVMQKLLVHRVEPAYPVEASKENLQGIVALDIVVGREGTVLSMRALNGPDVLVRAAMDALRWWKFEPYRVNGEPVVVESTVAVEFKK